MTILLGIDPGMKGALAFYDHRYPTCVQAVDMPIVDGHVDAANLADLVRRGAPDRAVVELVGAMPKQGVSSTFKFGRGFGTILGVLAGLGIPVELVAPSKWKRQFGLSSDKERSRALALQTFTGRPETFALKKHEARAEASFLALYGALKSDGLRQAGGATGGSGESPASSFATQ